jgi:CBS-domain-containing membrane protein
MRQKTPARLLHKRQRIVRRGVYLVDRNFLRRPKSYVVQAVMATVTLAIVIAIQDTVSSIGVTTAVGASAFIVFQMPHSGMAQPRRVVGGHLVAVIVGLTATALAHEVLGEPYDGSLAVDIIAACALGIAMLTMAMTDTEHPPGAATVVSLVLRPEAIESSALILTSAVALATIHHLTKRWLINLAH